MRVAWHLLLGCIIGPVLAGGQPSLRGAAGRSPEVVANATGDGTLAELRDNVTMTEEAGVLSAAVVLGASDGNPGHTHGAPPSPPSPSCAAYGCGGGYRPSNRCQCNPGCEAHGSCCSDYWARCLVPTFAPPPPPPTTTTARTTTTPPPTTTTVRTTTPSTPTTSSTSPTTSSPPTTSSSSLPSPDSSSSASAVTPEPSSSAAGTSTILTLYHQTSPDIGPKILEGGFRPGTAGWCGGAIYFAVSPEDTDKKAIAVDSHTGYIIEARVDLGRLVERASKCGVWDGATLQRMGYDSIRFNPGDGDEYVIYNSSRVLSTRHYQ